MAILTQKIVPHLWFDKEAKQAAEFYCTVFPGSKVDSVTVLENTPSGDCDVVSFTLLGQKFMAISAGPYFKFSEAISFMVYCDTQEEIDHYWSRLSADPKSEQCGWLKDKFGLSWQIVPTAMDAIRPGARGRRQIGIRGAPARTSGRDRIDGHAARSVGLVQGRGRLLRRGRAHGAGSCLPERCAPHRR